MRKIAFLKRGIFSHINGKILDALQREFPENPVEVIDIPTAFLRKNPHVAAINFLHILREYGAEILGRRKTVLDSFYNTPYIFSLIKRFSARLLKSRAADYLFTFQTQSLFDASVKGIPHFVYTDHTNLANLYYPGDNRDKLFGETWHRLEGQIYQNATITFTMSEHVRRSVIEQYHTPARQVSCVYAGSNAMSEPVTLENEGYSNQRILFVGKYWERKGGPELVEAFRALRVKYPQARLTIVGCSPEVNLPGCEVIGAIPPQELRKYFAQASIFCMPSRIEPFGIVFIEALLNRLPVVGPNMGALPDFVDEEGGGLLVQPGQVDQLRDSLDALLSDPARCRRLGEAGHERVKARYQWSAVGRRMREEILAAIEAPERRRGVVE